MGTDGQQLLNQLLCMQMLDTTNVACSRSPQLYCHQLYIVKSYLHV